MGERARARSGVGVPTILGIVASFLISVPACAVGAGTEAPDSTTRFDFIYSTSNGTKIDTFTDLYTKDLVPDRDTTIAFVLSREDMDRVRSKMLEVGFFDLPEPHPPYPPSETVMIARPNETIRIEAILGSKRRRIVWDTGKGIEHPTKAWRGLGQLSGFIWRLLEADPRSKALPSPRAGYL